MVVSQPNYTISSEELSCFIAVLSRVYAGFGVSQTPNSDIVERLQSVDYSEIKKYVPKERFVEFKTRINELLKSTV